MDFAAHKHKMVQELHFGPLHLVEQPVPCQGIGRKCSSFSAQMGLCARSVSEADAACLCVARDSRIILGLGRGANCSHVPEATSMLG